MKKNHPSGDTLLSTALAKVVRIMKLTTAFLIIGCLHVSANVVSQETRITLNLRDVSIPQLFKAIEKKTEYRFAYSNDILPPDFKVSIDVKDSPVSFILKSSLVNTGLKFSMIDEEMIVVSRAIIVATGITISGKVRDDIGNPIVGASVYVKGSATVGTFTNESGSYTLEVPDNTTALVFSSIGMETQEVAIGGKT